MRGVSDWLAEPGVEDSFFCSDDHIPEQISGVSVSNKNTLTRKPDGSNGERFGEGYWEGSKPY